MPIPFPVIDLFAGPGGLGEGFSAFADVRGRTGFDVRLSIEMDSAAHRTLLLRKFFREFDEPPESYVDYLAGRLTRDELFAQFPGQAKAALRAAWCAELGKKHQGAVTKRINTVLNKAPAWALIGGPPCQAYSLVGRSRMQSRTNPEFESDHRHLLYREYLRIVARHRPPVFLMENVKGLLSATHGGEKIFHRILADLHQPGKALEMPGRARVKYRLYSVGHEAQSSLMASGDSIPDPAGLIVRSESFGIPQARHRLFVLGIRDDLRVMPELLQPSRSVSVAEVLADLPRIRSTVSDGADDVEHWRNTVAAVAMQEWFRAPRNALEKSAALEARLALSSMRTEQLGTGGSGLPYAAQPARLAFWYRNACRGLTNHDARGHMASDLHRYFFAACFAKANGHSPTLDEFPDELMPKHANADRGRRGEMFADRFRVQLPGRPSSTITSHISKDGHYFIHYDPTQCRSLTVREAARLQTFPDSYHFEGPRTEQYHQVGNAVPPLLATRIAAIVHDVLLRI